MLHSVLQPVCVALSVAGCTQPDYHLIGSGCYRLVDADMQFAAAQTECSTDGSLLVALETQDEFNTLNTWLTQGPHISRLFGTFLNESHLFLNIS